tara:strand:- start:4051 stop:4935 length:885 start_codon:yes stop_codon:yes gene_type:complete
MGYNVRTAVELKDLILRRLGAPIINIEVTEEQVYDCIDRAIELFVEYHHQGADKTYCVRVLTANEAATGVIVFNEPILSISKIESSSSDILQNWSGSAVVTDWIFSLAGSGGKTHGVYGGNGISSGATQFDMVTWNILSQKLETIKRMLTPNPSYWYNGMNRELRLFDSVSEGDVIFIECYINTAMLINDIGVVGGVLPSHASGGITSYQPEDVLAGGGEDQIQNVYNVRWVRDMSAAYVKHLWGSILKKYGNQQLPGGLTTDGQTIFDEATTDLENLRQELYDIEEPLGILMG